MKKFVLSTLSLMFPVFVAFAGWSGPQLVPDYDRDGRISDSDKGRAEAGEPLVFWINDDNDEAGDGDTNSDLDDVPGGEGNDKDCEDDKVNGRCDLLDFIPVLVDVSEVKGWQDLTWKLRSDSVNVVFTPLDENYAGDFHTVKIDNCGPERNQSAHEATVSRLVDADAELPEGFLSSGAGVLMVEGAALVDDGALTIGGYDGDGNLVAGTTLKLTVTGVESMYGWMNLREKGRGTREEERAEDRLAPRREDASGTVRDNRHFVLVHGYNTDHEEARGNAAEFFKKLWQSGSDAMFTAVEWKGDQSRIEILGFKATPNYHVNVENAFAAAPAFKEACSKLSGEKILVGHSLGNLVIASAIKDYGLDYLKFVMLNAAVAREAFDPNAYDVDMVDEDWLGEKARVEAEGEVDGEESLTNHLDWASRWYRNFADRKYDPYEYRRKLAWRGRFANLPRTVNFYSQSDNVLVNPDPHEPDPDKLFDRDDSALTVKVAELLAAKLVNGKELGGGVRTGFGFWTFSEKVKGTWLIDVINDVLTNDMFKVEQTDAYRCEGGWGENEDYDDEVTEFDPANTRFTPFLDARLKTRGMLDILPAETERLRAQHLADAIPAESFAAGANPVATLENVDEESFIGTNPDWPLYEGGEGDGERTNVWNHSTFREVAFYHTSKLYASLVAIERQRVIIDTDLGSCMDDLFAIDLAARMQRAGKFELMAVMMNRPDGSDPEGKGEFLTFADRYLASLGLPDLPLGASSPFSASCPSAKVLNPYWTLIHSNNLTGVGAAMPTNRTAEQIASLTPAVKLYRRLLKDAPDKSVIICSTGFFNNLRELLESEMCHGGDDIVDTGEELIRAKVKELRIMAGCFDPAKAPVGLCGAEYNVMADPAAAKAVFEKWPSPIVVSPWEVGLELEYEPENVLSDFPAGTLNPTIRAVYQRWPEPEGEVMNRMWDPMTVLPLTEGESLVPLTVKGGISVDEVTGVTTFVPDPSSNRCYQVASNMNATAVMNRLREICRTGNPSVSLLVSGLPEPGVDYNGSELVFKFENISLGKYAEGDLKFSFALGGADYAPESSSWNETLGVLDVRFKIPPDVVTAGHVYNGTLAVMLENDELGTVRLTTASRQLVQGAIERDVSRGWFYECELEAPTNYVPAEIAGVGDMPERTTAVVETTFKFEEASPETDDPPEGAVQAAVRIVADGDGGYKFQYYGFVGKGNGYYYRGWHDFNVGGETAQEIKPTIGRAYVVRMEGFYDEDARGEVNTVAFWVQDGYNGTPKKQFVGNLVNKDGGLGGTTRLHSVEFAGGGTVSELRGEYCVNEVNANLARVGVGEGADATQEYATVAEAVAAAAGSPIRLLHAASWKPSAADLGESFRFLNKSWLNFDLSELPEGYNPVWTGVDGNNGTMTFMPCPGLAIEGTTELPGDFFLSFCSSRDLVMLSATGGVAWTKHEEQPVDRKQAVTGFWDFKRHDVGGVTYYSYHDQTGKYDNFGLDGFAPGERVILDQDFNVITSLTFEASGTVEKGHPLDGHDFLMIGLNHYILSGYLTNTVYNVPKREGLPSQVVYSYLQEVKDGEVVWDWKSTDYPDLYTMTVTNASPYAADFANEHTTVPDYVHFNAMRLNAGGDLVCSFRHLDAIICLDRTAKTDQIRWILSGKGDQFKLPDEAKTSAQHYVTVENDDTIRVFDNGNGRDPQQTRIMQYVINTNEMTATPEVLYAPANKFSAACGSAQVLDDGTLVIGWGCATRDAECLSVVTNGVMQMRVTLADPLDFTYRAVYCPPATSGRIPVTPGVPVGPFPTAEAASNAMTRTVFTPSEEVSAVLTTDAARQRYKGSFAIEVVPAADGQWEIAALMTFDARTNLAANVAAAVRQIPLAEIAALPTGETMPVPVEGCEPGFYYTLFGADALPAKRGGLIETALPVRAAAYGPELSGGDGKVTFKAVERPSPETGFFAVGAKETKGEEPR